MPTQRRHNNFLHPQGTIRKVAYVIGADASSLSCPRKSQSSENNIDGSPADPGELTFMYIYGIKSTWNYSKQKLHLSAFVWLNGRETPWKGNSSSQVDGCVRDQSRLCCKDNLDDLYRYKNIISSPWNRNEYFHNMSVEAYKTFPIASFITSDVI